MVKLSIQKLRDTGEWKVRWIEDGKLVEDKSYYTTEERVSR